MRKILTGAAPPSLLPAAGSGRPRKKSSISVLSSGSARFEIPGNELLFCLCGLIHVWTSHPAEYFSPFCGEVDVSPMTNSTVSPMTRQECFFLPTSSCTMDTAHWGKNLVNGSVDMAVPFRHRLSKPFDGLGVGDIHVMWQMLFFRQNARTRNEIARREAEWRSKNQAWPASGTGPACAAIHVRHGDKLTPFWIQEHDTIAGGFNKIFDDYLDVALKMMEDKPQLTDASRSKKLPLIFLMTDDADIIAVAKGSRRAIIHTKPPSTPLNSLSDFTKIQTPLEAATLDTRRPLLGTCCHGCCPSAS
ncbi:unnamed protein product [Prorocentrum cordatum]|uniref:Uncharacterized protein n=1 Tax=Prorocentrum cordatum TaxID=2364126 RepID=A0ABN9VXQ2_9DINO|nr:unnamed protein product [Polarella glacialis]